MRTFTSSQYGSEITAGPAKWGFFDGSYVSGDNGINGGWNHVASARAGSTSSRSASGARRKASAPRRTPTWTRILKIDVGYTLPQFHPELNTLGIIPQITFGLSDDRHDEPGLHVRQPPRDRPRTTGSGDVRDNLTWTRGRHTFKLGGYFEYMQNNEARGGNWTGNTSSATTSTNPLNTNFAFSNAVLGVFSQYTETDKYRQTQNRQWWSEWYAQDTWQLNDRD